MFVVGLLMLVAGTMAAVIAVLTVITYRRYRGTRLVTCPETRQPVAVEVDAARIALSAGLGGHDLRLRACSRWPERRDCGQECLAQIALAPEDCLVRSIVRQWVEGRSCALCGKGLDGVEHFGHQSALLGPHGGTVEWTSVRAERLPLLMRTHQPVCWDCHVAEEFRRLNPDLVVDRGRSAQRAATR
jgi:hypothetical protein